MAGWTSEELTLPEGASEEKDGFGLGPYKCPVCGAGLYQPYEGVDRYICLNACHLGESGARKFSAHMREVMGVNTDTEGV